MKRAKILLFFLAAALIFCLPDNKTYASAETPSAATYAQATARNVYFYKDKDTSTALFAIPYTYCVRILSEEDEWYYVRYADDSGFYRALYGYCLKENLIPVDVPPENVYLNKAVTVTYKTEAPPIGSLPVLNELTVTAAFYGTYYVGGVALSYVLCENPTGEDSFGYINGANDDYPLNELPSPPEPAAPKKKGANAKLIIALSLTALAAAALVILYFTGRHKRFARTEG
ncbi:MAG: hypothetical protein K2K60_02130 [Clostridia bacterium]|nr:hypothetical protein [Clostridia bacterium]